MESILPILIVFVFIAVVGRLIAGSMDGGRIEEYIRSKGGKLLEKHWMLLGPGWYGDKNRIYSIRFLDSEGNEHEAICKTSLLAGVYLTEDRITRRATTPQPASSPPPRHDSQLEQLGLPQPRPESTSSATSDAELINALLDENQQRKEEIARLKAGR